MVNKVVQLIFLGRSYLHLCFHKLLMMYKMMKWHVHIL